MSVCVMGLRRYMWNGHPLQNRHRNDDGCIDTTTKMG